MSTIGFNKKNNEPFLDKLGDKVDSLYDKKGALMSYLGGGMFIWLLLIGIIAYFVYDKNVDSVIGTIGFFLLQGIILVICSIPFLGIVFIILNNLFWIDSLMAILELEPSVVTSSINMGFLIIEIILWVLFTSFAIRAKILKEAISLGLGAFVFDYIKKQKEKQNPKGTQNPKG